MRINESTYNAIMLQAMRAARREGWMSDAVDAEETAGITPAESIRAKFEPFAVRLLEAAQGIPADKAEAFKDAMFSRFVGMTY